VPAPGAAFERLGSAAVRVLPAPLLTRLARAQRPLARYAAAAKWRRYYPKRFVWALGPEDDLLHYTLEFAAGAHSALRYYHGVRMYFEGGKWNCAEVEKVLADAGFTLAQARSMLEFACGYGRLTRHFVHLLPAERITGSDIDPGAVAFVRRRFGVDGFTSTASPDRLSHGRRYQLIVVVSLFSHLPLDSWGPWLSRLHSLLEDDGLLLFSTLGRHAYDTNLAPEARERFTSPAPGFHYSPENETRGRLSGRHYGIAYVEEAFVRRAVAEAFDGALVSFVPRALNDFQDAYVLRRG
jgi:SAM-dependent methyltransferase